ncbi:TonB-dependent receptor [Gayadomonas joobiniege]|uniref:TonB-dependent receptor n=1 Tax=Gayadomonas joobiniege TaxID=1234606 RepID=UPI0003622BDC|nr:TonB-dependent receptor [Gayadomonas joobiniege]
MTNKDSKKLTYLSGCIFACIASAELQAASSDGTEVIEVRGNISRSLSEAVNHKRFDNQFVDAIVASDVGKLPDTTVAESLGRIPGVQIDRGIGQGSDISIRGLKQNVTLLNGRQVWDSAGRGASGPDQLGTSTYGLLGTVPSALINRMEVEKLSAADQVSGGLGGVVNIVTHKPFDKLGERGALSLGVQDEELGGFGHEIYGLYSNTFLDDKLGLLINFNQSSRESMEQGLGTYSGYGRATNELATYLDAQGSPISSDVNNDGVDGILHLDPRQWQIGEERDRRGLNAVVQYQATDSLVLTVDHFDSKLESERARYWLAYVGSGVTYRNANFNQQEVLISGVVEQNSNTNVEYADISSAIASTAVNAKWFITDNLSLFAEYAYTESEGLYDQQYARLQTIDKKQIEFDLSDGDFGRYDYKQDFSASEQFNVPVMFFQQFFDNSIDNTMRVDIDWTLDQDIISSVEFGAYRQQLETSKHQLRYFDTSFAPAGGVTELYEDGIVKLHTNHDYMKGELEGVPREFLTFAKLPFSGGGVAGCMGLADYLEQDKQARCISGQDAPGPQNAFNIEETFTALYTKANFLSELMDFPISGNFGLRYLSRSLDSTGVVENSGELSDQTFNRDDSHLMPSAVAKIELQPDLLLRMGTAKVVSYPATSSLRNNIRLFPEGTPPVASGGAPDLNPFEANQYDISLEWYFNQDSMLSGGLFYKDINTFIVTQTQTENIKGVDYLVTREINGDGAKVKGLEVAYQQPLEVLEGLGTLLTYTFIDGETPMTDSSGRTLSFPGLSENNINAILYYEKDQYNLRLAYNWRDEYLNSISSANTGAYFDTYEDLSFTAQYQYDEQITVTFNASNLLDSQLRTYDSVKSALRSNTVYGRAFKLSASYLF